MKRIVVMISGGGTNLQALIDAMDAGTIPDTQIVGVVSHRKSAYGLVRAQNADIPTVHFPLAPFTGKPRQEYDSALASKVAEFSPDLVVLAGWMRILTPAFLDRFPNRVINLHPALPGVFPGMHGLERAFAAYQNGDIEHSGCMVHYVVPEVDAGPVIVQEVVPIEPDDTEETFSARLWATENRIIVEAVNKALSNL